MDLPSDIYAPILSFFPARDLLWFRLISKVHLDASKMYDQTIVSNVPLKCFPRSKHIPHCYSNTHFDAHIKLTYLILKTPIHPDAFKKLPHLQKLEIYSYKYHVPLVTTPMFYTLSSLTFLFISYDYHVTDDIFLHLHQLQQLYLSNCTQIKSKGIRSLKNLKIAYFHDIPQITDEAFIDSGIILLQITSNQHITDQGILGMKQLKHLTLARTPNIRGEFATLDLDSLRIQIPIGKTMDELKSELKHIQNLYIMD